MEKNIYLNNLNIGYILLLLFFPFESEESLEKSTKLGLKIFTKSVTERKVGIP